MMAHDNRTSVKTTVIIPVYNTEGYLPACLDSVLAQTQREIEVILVDDGSTDGSLAIERAYAKRDPRVRVLQQPNLRQGTARNRGLSEARGEFVYFMDSDDLIVPEHFETCYNACQADNLDFVTFDTAGFREDPNIERPELFREVSDRCQVTSGDIVDGVTFWLNNHVPWICWLEYFRRSFLLENNLQFVERIYFEDNDWIARVYLAAKRLRYLPQKLHRYRDRPGSNVHSGFSEALAWSCFDVFDITTSIRDREIEQGANAGRLRIIEDVINGMSLRFREFAELDANDALLARLLEFKRMLADACEDESIPLETRQMHLCTLLNVEIGLAKWRHCDFDVPVQSIKSVLLPNLPATSEAKRVGLYGTGTACNLLLHAWDVSDREIVFLETKASPGQTYSWQPKTETLSPLTNNAAIDCQPVHSIDDVMSLDLDAIVITSKKYAESMRQAVDERAHGAIPVYVLTRHILALKAFVEE